MAKIRKLAPSTVKQYSKQDKLGGVVWIGTEGIELQKIIDRINEDYEEHGIFYNDVRYTLDKEEYKDPVYTVMGCFITAYARDKTIRSAQSVYDRFIYADTDSLHLEGTEIPDILDIHPTRLGAWKHEGTFCDSLFIRAKTYMESYQKEDGSINTVVTCAGMPDNVKESVTYENFHSGSSFSGKLLPKRYEGGIVLTDTLFTIK